MNAIVLNNNRRQINVLTGQEEYTFPIQRKYNNLIAGDHVELENDCERIKQVFPRENLLQRANKHRSKEIVANLDALFIVTAPPPLFNTHVLDRTLAIASLEHIPCVIIFNKSDLGVEDISAEIEYYQKLADTCHVVSAKNDIQGLVNYLQSCPYKQIALCGVSGVGKSTILKTLLGDDKIQTSKVAEKTGQGRQTTSQAQGYQYGEQVIFDLPGIQNFGSAHLELDQIRFAFPDFIFEDRECEYRSCLHFSEENCAVKSEIGSRVLESRYRSYKDIYQEVKELKSFSK